MSNKPKSSICNKCFVKRNRLRCALCVHKTFEWLCENPSPIIADLDCFKERNIASRMADKYNEINESEDTDENA